MNFLQLGRPRSSSSSRMRCHFFFPCHGWINSLNSSIGVIHSRRRTIRSYSNEYEYMFGTCAAVPRECFLQCRRKLRLPRLFDSLLQDYCNRITLAFSCPVSDHHRTEDHTCDDRKKAGELRGDIGAIRYVLTPCFRKPPSSPHEKWTVHQSADVFEDTVFKPGFDIIEF